MSNRRKMFVGLQILVSVAAFAYVLSGTDLGQLLEAAQSVPPTAIAIAIALTAGNLTIGAERWRLLLLAYGATSLPSRKELIRLYFVGYFYNTFVPGGVGGDIVRGVVSRQAFGEAGVGKALTVVLVERVLGLVGLLAVVALALAGDPPEELASLVPLSALGLIAALAGVAALAMAQRLSPRLPEPLASLAEKLPAFQKPAPFGAALALSLVTHSVVALSGYALLKALVPSLSLAATLIIVPTAMATAFLPITVAGAGTREAALVYLATRLTDANDAQATAASLMLFATTLLVGAIGGLMQSKGDAQDATRPEDSTQEAAKETVEQNQDGAL